MENDEEDDTTAYIAVDFESSSSALDSRVIIQVAVVVIHRGQAVPSITMHGDASLGIGVVASGHFSTFVTHPGGRRWDTGAEEFWAEPQRHEILQAADREGKPYHKVCDNLAQWLMIVWKSFPKTMFVADLPHDAGLLDLMLAESNLVSFMRPDAITFNDRFSASTKANYVGGPIITDDEYRGELGSTDQWGLGKKIRELYHIDVDESKDHDALADAKEIGLLYDRSRAVRDKRKYIRDASWYHRPKVRRPRPREVEATKAEEAKVEEGVKAESAPDTVPADPATA